MKVVPLSYQTVEGAVLLEGSPLAALAAPIIAGQPCLLDRDLIPPRLLDDTLAKDKDLPPDLGKPKAITIDELVKFLEGMGFTPTVSQDKIVVPTNYPGVNLEITRADNGKMKAQMKGPDGRVHAEMSSFTQASELLHFMNDHQITAPKIVQKQETAVRRPMANKALVDMGF